MVQIPFVVGQWVRGERFYGRGAQIGEILDGPRNSVWLLGTRRIGKTSLLKQLEHLTATQPQRGYFPVFWDFQGSEDVGELHQGFNDALLDAEERLEAIGLSAADVEADDLFASLGHLRRKLRTRKLRPLLLCDEVEELIRLNAADSALLRKLRRALQSQDDIRTVLASTVRLWALTESNGDTSPFLHGFTPPIYIRTLADVEARELIRQEHLASDARPHFDEMVVETIRQRCDNHPYLIQLVCKRCLEQGNLEDALEEVATDRMVSYFFSVDFEMLAEAEHDILRIIAEHTAATSASIQEHLPLDDSALRAGLHRLENLGFIRRNEERRFVLANFFFRRWLRELPRAASVGPLRAGRDSMMPTPALGVEPQVIADRYDLLQEIGEGATGVVYAAYDRLLDAKIALKLLKPEYARYEEALERVRQETVLARDIGHPNILRVYDLGEVDGRPYLTMQWVEGPTLAQLIAARGPIPEEAVLLIAGRVASALEAAHARRILHRDIKPQNILLDERQQPFLSDFGLARLVSEPGTTRTGVFLGTPHYASPEQADLRPLDERSDLYSLGVVLFEMITGRRPFEADSVNEMLEMHRSTPPPDPRELAPSISPELARLILRCMEKDRGKRYGSAAELRQELEKLLPSRQSTDD